VPSAPQRALELYGIISLDVSGASSPVRGVNVLAFRDLGALVADATYAVPAATPQHIAEYRRVVEGAFARQTIVPAQFGSIAMVIRHARKTASCGSLPRFQRSIMTRTNPTTRSSTPGRAAPCRTFRLW